MSEKSITFLLAFLVFSLLSAEEVFAHATPITYEPEASVILESIPSRVQIYFSERIEPHASGITIFGPDGSRADNNDAAVSPKDSHYYSATLKDAGEGTYTVSWQVVSLDDGHFTKGAFSFSVGVETASSIGGQIQIQHITTLPQAATIGIELVGQAMLLGAFLLFAFLWRPLRKQFNGNFNAPSFEKRFVAFIGAGIIFIVLGVASFIVIKTFDLQQLRSADFSTTLAILLDTVDGSFALYRAILGFAIGIVFFVARKLIFRSERFTKTEVVLAILLSLMLLDRARVSHAAASHFYPSFSIFINFLHLLFKEFWVGGLIALTTLFLPALAKTKNALAKPFAFISFSKFVSVAFGGVGITGAYIIWLHLKDPQFIFSTEWGSRFIVLFLFAIVLFAARLWHQFLVEKSAVDICAGKSNSRKERLVRWTRYSFPFETLVGVVFLFVTSLSIITTPPYSSAKFAFEKHAQSQGAVISLATHPYEQKQFLITVTDNKSKSELPLTDLVVTLTNEEKGIGPIVVDTEQRFIGGYIFPTSLLSPHGSWNIDISARRSGVYDSVASFSIDYPRELEATLVNPDTRPFGFFEMSVLLAALGFMALAFLFFRFSQKLNLVCVNLVNGNSTSSSQAPKPDLKILPSWLIAGAGLIIVSFLVWSLNDQLLKTDFQKLCEKNGHFWLQSAPVRDGQALSSDTVTGCFLDVELYHFADEREYKFFFQKREILAELAYSPTTLTAGVPADLAVSLSEIRDGRKIGPAKEIGVYHDRILHAIIVGEDLKTFAHIHPEDLDPITEEINPPTFPRGIGPRGKDLKAPFIPAVHPPTKFWWEGKRPQGILEGGGIKKNARFPLRYTFPKAGRYTINVDYVASGRELSKSFTVNVEGKPKMEQASLTSQNGLQMKEFDGYRITLFSPRKIKAGERIKLRYYIEKDGKQVRDLEPYLAAAMHIAMVRQDLARFTHTHGEAYQPGSVWFQQLLGKYFKYHIHFAPDRFGPTIITQPWTTVFPSPGIYQVFGEFKHEGRAIVFDFTVEVE